MLRHEAFMSHMVLFNEVKMTCIIDSFFFNRAGSNEEHSLIIFTLNFEDLTTSYVEKISSYTQVVT